MTEFDDLSDEPPAELSEHARVFWLRLSPVLWRRGFPRHVGEQVQFEQLCLELGIVAECEDRLRVDGLTVIDSRRREIPHPSISIRARYAEHARESMQLLGLDPDEPELAARHGLGTGKPS